MEFKPKTEEHIQAQVEYFTGIGVGDFSAEQKLLLKSLEQLTTITDLNNLPKDLPKEVKELVEKNRDKYVDILREAKKEDIDFRKENAELYNSKFKPAIETLKSRISSSSNPKELPEYLGSGSNGSAYMIEVDDKKYAAKFSRSLTQANYEIKPLLQAKGIENTAQLVSYSFVDGVVIMELLPGTDVTNFIPENAPKYPDEHIVKLIEIVIELNKKGIVIDPKPSNFIYNEKEGFSILDFHLSNGTQSIGDLVMSLKYALTARKWQNLDYNADDYNEKLRIQRLEKHKIELPMMVRFLTILQNQFPEVLDDWKKAYQKREEDPRIRQYPPINREYMETEHPELKPHLAKLEEMGF